MKKNTKRYLAMMAVMALGIGAAVGLTGCGKEEVEEPSKPIEVGDIAKEDRENEASLNKEIVFPSGEKMMLKDYIKYDGGHVIQFTTSDIIFDQYQVDIIGEDNLGNPVNFMLVEGVGGEGGSFLLDEDLSKLSPEATSIKVGVFAASYEEGSLDEKTLMGDEFTIELK